MRIEYLLFTIYLFLCFWAFPKITFIKKAKLSTLEIRFLLAFKVLAGIACAIYFTKFSTNVDYTEYNAEGKLQYDLLRSDPGYFFKQLTIDIDSYGLGGLFASKDSFWAYLRFNLLYKFIAILNMITRGNFYFNSAIFSSIVFWGHIAFFRIYSEIYKDHRVKIILVCFFIPSVLLYTSCVHKDGIVFLALGLTSYCLYRALCLKKIINLKYIFPFFLGLITIFMFRNYVIIVMVPAMVIAMLCRILPYKMRWIAIATYALFVGLFFLSGFNNSPVNMPAAVAQRKADFIALGEAKTNITMNELRPDALSFISNIPQAINHSLFRPYLWEFTQPSILLTALELLVYQLLFLLFLLYRKKDGATVYPFNIFAIIFFLNMMLIIGFTIPNIGAIVRYRSIFWIFLICPLVCNTDWKSLFSFQKPSLF